MNKLLLPAALVAALSVSGVVAAATIVAPGTSHDSVNKSLTVGSGTQVKDVETVNGSIEVESKSSAAEVETVNGSIDVGDDVSVESLATVNGSIRAGSGLKVSADVETVNGRIEIGAGAAIQGSVSTVNGRVQLQQSSVARNVETVNGGLSLDNARIGGNVELVNGRADLREGTIVAGDLIVRKPKGNWGWGKKSKPPVVVIGAGSEVGGRVIIENEEAKVYVHESARVGAVEGVQATRYSGTSAPE
jgi:DUF4097 and DUF4098 domain-containing protein YvlB